MTFVFGVSECYPAEFQCDSGLCLHADAVCNGINDCGDLSDEQNCSMSGCHSHFHVVISNVHEYGNACNRNSLIYMYMYVDTSRLHFQHFHVDGFSFVTNTL